MLLVTFHGGKSGYRNVHLYADSGSDTGECLEKHVLQGDWPHADDAELRGIGLVKGDLWVVNGAKGASSSLMIFEKGPDHHYDFVKVFLDSTTTSAVNHPFAFTFDDDGNCYVSNQDTNVVARFSSSGAPCDIPASLPRAASPQPNYNSGTFVASSDGSLDGTPATVPVPTPLGLRFSVDSDGKVQHSVRGALYFEGWSSLLVCDETARAVKVYGESGDLRAVLETIADAPTHLAVWPSNLGPILLIAAGATIYEFSLSKTLKPGVAYRCTPTSIAGLEAGAGMTFNDAGHVFIADRKAKEIYKYISNGSGWDRTTIVDALGDNPEFICHI